MAKVVWKSFPLRNHTHPVAEGAVMKGVRQGDKQHTGEAHHLRSPQLHLRCVPSPALRNMLCPARLLNCGHWVVVYCPVLYSTALCNDVPLHCTVPAAANSSTACQRRRASEAGREAMSSAGHNRVHLGGAISKLFVFQTRIVSKAMHGLSYMMYLGAGTTFHGDLSL